MPDMDPAEPSSFAHKTEILSTGRVYHFIDQQPEDYDPKSHPTILCVHGFPDSWYGWRYQIGPWVRRGYRVVVPDMLGYGGSSKPVEPEEYTMKKICGDLAALLDLLKVEKAVVIGHDWGSFTSGRFALWHPDRLLALVMLSVPYTPPSREYLSLTEVAKRAPNLGYQLYFAEQRSSFEILAHLKKFIGLVFSTPSAENKHLDFTPKDVLPKLLADPSTPENLPTCLNDQERAFYLQHLSLGMQGPLNYYRTSQLRHEEELAGGLKPNLPESLPVLFMWGTADATCTEFVVGKARKFIQRYQDIAIEGKGHWLMVEAREEVTGRIMEWLESLTCARRTQKALL